MKIESPPKTEKHDFNLYLESLQNPDKKSFLEEVDKRYFYWSELKYRPNIPYDSILTAWSAIKTKRQIDSTHIEFSNHKFSYNITEAIQENLHNFDLNLMGNLKSNSLAPFDQLSFLKNSLLEEAIASSQLEGAATTTNVAKELIKSGRKPHSESEQMILNNYRAIKEIETKTDQPLSLELILEIHELMTTQTEANQYSGKIRETDVFIKDHLDGEIAFQAPNSTEIPDLLDDLIFFINNESKFLHPIIKASILHFLVGYIHPFGDGNGRTARALFYWYLIKKGYVLLKHISISKAILESRTSYDKAFLKTEHDDNDLTYFILYSLKSLRVAFEKLLNYAEKKKEEAVLFKKNVQLFYQKGFNLRQSDLLGYLSIKNDAKIDIKSYSERHDIVRQTAGKDLQELEAKNLIIKQKNGKTYIFKLKTKDNLNQYLEN